jgi:hypothetical protein
VRAGLRLLLTALPWLAGCAHGGLEGEGELEVFRFALGWFL